MASARVERMLGEIARLSDAERSEVLNSLLEMLRGAAGSRRLSMDAVEQAVSTRERIRRRLADTGQSAGSISADLEDVREGRLAELSDDWAAQDFPQ
jgi:hypothetical protein